MIAALKRSMDALLGRGDAAITVPPMDGPLKPNQCIENAETVRVFDDAQDLAFDGHTLWVADGPRLWRSSGGQGWQNVRCFDRPATALACLLQGGVAVALGGEDIQVLDGRGWKSGPREIGGEALRHVNALCAAADGSLIATEASRWFPPAQWSRDLLEQGATGRVCRLSPSGKDDAVLASGLRHAFGAVARGDALWVAESWAHRVIALDAARATDRTSPMTERLPGYPSRLCAAADGGAWLTLFAVRSRLVEFVLREPAYRRRMIDEVDPRYWVAPALSSGHSFLEPLQGGSVKQLGIMKPWAPPRSYGLVVKLDASGLPLHSLHSRADGVHHGIVAAAEAEGHLYLLSRGAGRLLRVPLDILHAKEPA